MRDESTGERLLDLSLFGIVYPLEALAECGLPKWARVCLLPISLSACFLAMLICFPLMVVGIFVLLAEAA